MKDTPACASFGWLPIQQPQLKQNQLRSLRNRPISTWRMTLAEPAHNR